MKKTLLIMVLVSLIACSSSPASQKPLANDGINGLYARSIEQVLRLQPDEIDLATAALIISEQWSDMVNGRRYLSELDEMAYEIRERLEEKKIVATFKAVEVINDYLFEELRFRSVKKADKAEDLFLHSVMDNKRGYCLSLSVLYLSIGERLGLPLYGVVVPGHFFVRYDDGRIRFNIETTGGGGYNTDEHYINKFKVPEDSEDTIYMKNLNKLQTLGCFFNNLGNVYSEIGDIDTAQLALERAVEINPSLAETRTNLGNIYLRKDRIEDAIYEYRSAIGINPNDSKTHNNLGNAYTKKQWYGEAIAEYTYSLRMDANFIDCYMNLASVYSKRKMYSEAIEELKQALSIEPRNADLYCQLGDVYYQKDDYELAVTQYKNALKYNRGLAEAYLGLAGSYGKQGLEKEEIKAYKKAISIKPDMTVAIAYLGNAYFTQKKYDKAIEQYKKALSLGGGDVWIYYNLAAAYSNEEDYEQAVPVYEKALAIDSGNGDAHYQLSYAYYKLKKYEPALKHIGAARQLGVEVDEELLKAITDKLE